MDSGTLRPLRAQDRRWVRMNLRLVTAATAVVLAGATTFAVVAAEGGDVDGAVAMSPPSVQDEDAEMTVFLCSKADPEDVATEGVDPKEAPPQRCKGSVTPDEVEVIERKLKAFPQVRGVYLVDQANAYEDFKKTFAHNQAMLDTVEVTDLPQSFRVTFEKGADRNGVSRALVPVAGVWEVMDHAMMGPVQTAAALNWEISVFLCKKGSATPACGGRMGGKGLDAKATKEGKGATAAEKKAVEVLIRKTPEVVQSIFESEAEAYQNFREAFKSNQKLLNATKVEDMPESFRIRLKQQSSSQDITKKLRKQPGVAQVVDHSCSADKAALMAKFGVVLPESKICSVGD
ncbi:permease-like cell division protein FtsX [Nonomuraea antimicrobica]|uniref:permease-like cell division protein FtsX n=1 Tax=Nonomuraea antimicrobica TaxID=561173 RepID=UPI0031E7A081